ncbi:MAG: (2Fe-2S) ferredoxin domain-containing protein [Tissierellia bacterium]|nr:(2Fe-2S) ferredoxin domain-containing protein [Tissierellia bacterium]
MKVKVCVGTRCTMMGSNGILDALENIKKVYFDEDDLLEIEPVNCLSFCRQEDADVTPVVIVNGEVVTQASAQEVTELVLRKANKIH